MKSKHADTLNSPAEIAEIQINTERQSLGFGFPNSTYNSSQTTSYSNSSEFQPEKKRGKCENTGIHLAFHVFFRYVIVR